MADVAQGNPSVTEYMDPQSVATYDAMTQERDRYRKALERLTATQEDFDACDCGDHQPAMFHADDCPMFERWLAVYNELAALDPEAR